MPSGKGLDKKGQISAGLSRGGIASAISQQYPQFSERACLAIEDILLEKISQAIMSGHQVGIVEQRPDGTVAISVMMIEEVIDQMAEQG